MKFKIPAISKFYMFQFFQNFHFFSAVLIPFYTQWASMSVTTALYLQAWFAFWMFLLEIPTGVVADKYGRKKSMILGSFISVFGLIVYAARPDILNFLVGEFLLALSVALVSGADEAWLYENLSNKADMQKIHGRSRATSFSGIMIASLIGSWMAVKMPLNFPMLASAASSVCATLVLFSLPPEKKRKQTSVSKQARSSLLVGIKFLYKHPELKWFTLNIVSLAIIAYFSIWLYQPILESIDFSIGWNGVFHSLILISEIAILMNLEKIEEHLKMDSYLKVSAFIVGLSFILVGLLPHLFTALGFVLVAGGVGLTRIDYTKGYLHDRLPDDIRATIGSSISFYKRLGIAIANLIVGLTASWNLSLTLVILGFMAVAVCFIKIRPAKINLGI